MGIHNGENRICVEDKQDGTYDRALGTTMQNRGRSGKGSVN